MLIQILSRLEKTLSQPAPDMSALAKMFALLCAFIAPLHTLFGIMVFFIFADTLSAIYHQYRKVKRRRDCDKDHGKVVYRISCISLFWRVVDSDRLLKTVEKFFAYPVTILVCYVFDKTVLGINPTFEGVVGQFSLTNVCFVLICMADFRSFLRNMGQATGNSLYVGLERLLKSRMKQ